MHSVKLGYTVRMMLAAVLALLIGAGTVRAQIPGLPAAPSAAPAGAKQEKKKAVAAASGPITVSGRISDHTIERFLTKFLPKYPGVRT